MIWSPSVPSYDICNVDKHDGGLTFEELHAASCQDYIASIGGDLNEVDPDFEFFDADSDGIVSSKEFFDGCTKLTNA